MGQVTLFLNKILEYKREACFITNANECFRKCVEYIYKKDFSREYRVLIQSSDAFKKIMSSAKTQPFRKRYNLNSAAVM